MFRILLLVFAVGQVAALDVLTFKNTLADKCIPDPSLWQPESAVSVENFIYMVEKLENDLRLSTENLVRMLLHRYSCFGLMRETNGEWNRVQPSANFEVIADQFLDKYSDEHDIPENKKCQMFYMLSQGIQDTEIRYPDIHLKFEHGVLSLNGDKERAIDISKVLYGVLAGFNKIEKSIESFIATTPTPEEFKGKKLDSLFAFTISELMTSIVSHDDASVNGDYSDEGKWSSTLCAKEYTLGTKHFLLPTLAQVIGAIDGFILGSKIHEMSDRNVKLSQILRMYYSREGFKNSLGDQSVVSHCKRNDGFVTELNKNSQSTEEFRDQSWYYMTVFTRLTNNHKVTKQRIEDAVKNFRKNLNTIVQMTKAEEVACQKEMDQDICETPSNAFVILDKRREDTYTMQKSIVGELIDELNIGLNEDTISIYLNSVIMELEEIVNASESKSYASCTLDSYNQNQIPAVTADSDVLVEIQNKLDRYEKEQSSQPGVPAKVIVYFNFGEGSNTDTKLENAGRDLRTRHPYTTVIPIGISKDYLGKYFSNGQPVRVLLWNTTTNLAAELKEHICKAPAVLQHRDCNAESKLESTKYTGYVTEDHVQHWMMEPKDFLKSFSYKFVFKAEIGKIRVCFNRNGPIADSSDRRCLSSNNGIVEVKERDPCKGRTVHTCNPFFFSVFGRMDDEKPNERCISDEIIGCKRLDQIKYTIQHEGLSCNGATKLISTPVFQTLLAFFITFYILLQQK